MKKRIFTLLLALLTALTLTACGSGDTGTSGKPLPGMPGKTQEPDSDPAYSDQAQADLDRLRSDLREGGYLFGAANFGYLEQGQTPGEWANAMDPATCAAYSFIPEIPDGQVVGTGGCLLCLVPVDPDATVSVNRIRWHENGDGFEQEEVLYRSETGQPVFLLVEDDPDMPGYSSVQVNIVGDSGFVDWYPTVVGGQLDLANDGQGPEDPLSHACRRAEELHVRLVMEGPIPREGESRRLTALAIRECLTNCVRHAGGTELYVSAARQEGGCTVTITNNGRPPWGEIIEGGGLSALRRIEGSGGTMTAAARPRFALTIHLPEKEDIL